MTTTQTISANAGHVTAGGNVGDINSGNFTVETLNVYSWDPGERRNQLTNRVSDLDSSPYQSQATHPGDVLKTVDRLAKVAATLRGISSEEQRALLCEIQSLSGALIITKEIIEKYYSDSDPHLATNLAPSISQAVLQCRVVLNNFLRKAIHYKKLLSRTSIGNLWKTVWSTATGTDEVRNLRNKLANHRSQIGLFLSGLNLTSTQATLDQLRQTNTISPQTVAKNAFRHFMHPPVPHCIEQKTLRITDALGQVIPIPLTLCTSWDFLHGILLGYFQGRLGLSYVSAGAYDLVDPDCNVSFDASSFALLLKEGVLNLEMCMISRSSREQNHRKCPRCKHINSKSSGWVTCSQCSCYFEIIVEARFEDEGDIISPAARQQLQPSSSGGGNPIRQPDEKELQYFRRIRLVHQSVSGRLFYDSSSVSPNLDDNWSTSPGSPTSSEDNWMSKTEDVGIRLRPYSHWPLYGSSHGLTFDEGDEEPGRQYYPEGMIQPSYDIHSDYPIPLWSNGSYDDHPYYYGNLMPSFGFRSSLSGTTSSSSSIAIPQLLQNPRDSWAHHRGSMYSNATEMWVGGSSQSFGRENPYL